MYRTQYIVLADYEARRNRHMAAIAPVTASSTLRRRNLKTEVWNEMFFVHTTREEFK